MWWAIRRDERGQMVTELFVAIPSFLLTLVVISNLFAYIALSAKLDKMTNEVVRQLYQIPATYYGSSSAVLERALQKKAPRRVYISLSYIDAPGEYLNKRKRVMVRLLWTPFSSRSFAQRMPVLSTLFVRTKQVYVPSAEMVIAP